MRDQRLPKDGNWELTDAEFLEFDVFRRENELSRTRADAICQDDEIKRFSLSALEENIDAVPVLVHSLDLIAEPPTGR